MRGDIIFSSTWGELFSDRSGVIFFIDIMGIIFYPIIRVCIYHNIRGIFIYVYIGIRGDIIFVQASGHCFYFRWWVKFLLYDRVFILS